MFMYLQKNKKGFTLIELMVVVAIIGILALLGLRLYTGQQEKAKESIVKANASTVHTLIQSELADGEITDVLDKIGCDDDDDDCANMENPLAPENPDDPENIVTTGTIGTDGDAGVVVVEVSSDSHFLINACGAGGSTDKLFTSNLEARR
jgi:prepilin-type N-terminal cleavage/methylation domain-containing protein